MDIQKIKELALANGFKLKEQASGNMDLHPYVYEFAQAIFVETINQAQLVFGQDGVTVFDTETLDSEISNISSEFEAEYFFDNDDADRLEILIAKAMKLGELYERQKWQQAQKVAVPDGFVLVEKKMLLEGVNKIEQLFEDDPLLALGELLPIQQGLKAMIEAQEQVG